ncbi:MAG: acyl-CoA thioesterase [Treponemataceae bacterium]|nr:acyl-CoA thioesterase [Treponemataceae bacterium]
MTTYTRKVNYHETDKMGITHHSNYIKFMEEARVDALEKLGMPFEKVEEEGIGSPIVSLTIDYKSPTKFSDVINVDVRVISYNGIKLEFSYTMTDAKTGTLVATAQSSHCFIKDGRIYSFRRDKNPMDALIQQALEADTAKAE